LFPPLVKRGDRQSGLPGEGRLVLKYRVSAFAASLAALLCLGAAAAEKPTGADREFMMNAAMGSLAEVKLGQLAVERGSDGVKKFAKRMAEDHGKASTELTGLAREKGVALPADVAPEHKVALGRLAALSGKAFDRAYAVAMVEAHQKDVGDFESEAARGEDPDVKAWASRMLPALRMHLKMARDLASRLGPEARR
jgi:putative membrane protein